MSTKRVRGNGNMNRESIRNGLLAFIGLGALTAYILACASFSPDDSKIVFPAYDRISGHIGVALYDRKGRTTEQLFVLATPSETSKNGCALRPQWTPDGRYVIVAWPGEGTGDTLYVQVLPVGRAGPTRLLILPGIEKAEEKLSMPLPLVGPYVFLTGKSNIVRLDLETGAIKTNFARGELALYASPAGDRVYYAGKGVSQEGAYEVGRLEVDRLTLTPLLSLPSDSITEEGLVGLGRDGGRMAFLSEKGGETAVLVYRGAKLEKTLRLGGGESRLKLGHVQWSPDGQTLYAAYWRQAVSATNCSFGVLEMPLNDRPMRHIPVLEGLGNGDDSDIVFFQIGLSHDGKTIAVASTYLTGDEKLEMRPEDCALFLVDLSSPKRPVLRVRLPLPPKTGAASSKS
jgi:hypothetical protein